MCAECGTANGPALEQPQRAAHHNPAAFCHALRWLCHCVPGNRQAILPRMWPCHAVARICQRWAGWSGAVWRAPQACAARHKVWLCVKVPCAMLSCHATHPLLGTQPVMIPTPHDPFGAVLSPACQSRGSWQGLLRCGSITPDMIAGTLCPSHATASMQPTRYCLRTSTTRKCASRARKRKRLKMTQTEWCLAE